MRHIKFAGIITARKNSERVKNKNLILINKKPLLEYSLIALKKSKKIKNRFITSDCDKMLQLGKRNKINLIKRPANLASSLTTSEDTLLHAIQVIIDRFKLMPENIIFIQPTSPLLKSNDLDMAINKFIKTKADSLFSSYKAKFFIWKKINNNYKSYTFNSKKRQSTKKFKEQVVENGAFFIFNTKKFLNKKNRLFDKIETFSMPKYRSFEVDYEEDVEFLKRLKF